MIVCEIALIWSFIWGVIEMHFYMHSIGEILGLQGFPALETNLEQESTRALWMVKYVPTEVFNNQKP